MKNKGVSAVIATVLLVLIAIALVGVSYLYFSGMLSGRTVKTISISDISCLGGNITIVLANDGTKSVEDSEITVLVDNQPRSDKYYFGTGTIASHSTATAVSDVAETTGQEHTVLVTSPSNSDRRTVTC